MIHLLLLLACGLSGRADSGDSADTAPDLGDPNSTDPALACPPWEEGMTSTEYDALLAQLPSERVIAVTVDVWDPVGACFSEQVGLYSARYWCPEHGPVGPDAVYECNDEVHTVVDPTGACAWFNGYCPSAHDPALRDCRELEGCCEAAQASPNPNTSCNAGEG